MKKHIPNFITCLNLFSGCLGIYFFSKINFTKAPIESAKQLSDLTFDINMLHYACYMIFIAALLDFFDGFAARLLHVSSEIGKQLDSLADAVSFGVLPGLIVCGMLKITVSLYDIESSLLKEILTVSGFTISIFSVIRLAKFNLDTRQSERFIGLPTPANSIFFAGLGLLLFNNQYNLTGAILNLYLLLGLVLLFSYLLVCELPLISLKFKNFSWADNKFRFIILALSLVSLIALQLAALPLIIIFYIIISIIENKFSHHEVQS